MALGVFVIMHVIGAMSADSTDDTHCSPDRFGRNQPGAAS